ncbi:EAL domain-containing protein [Proteobacteria bacterium 005FR1]|nr:EAL domain-containing protein [Proteobacteria bacterium 005FR1]
MKAHINSLLRKISSIAPLGLHEVRQAPDGSLRLVQAAADIVEIFGSSPAQLAEDYSRLWAAVHPGDQARAVAELARSAKAMTPARCEARVQHPRKGEIWVMYFGTPERLSDGAIAWYGYFQDITQSKRTEAALEETQRSIATLMDNLPGVAYRCLNDPDWTMEFISSGIVGVTGHLPIEIVSRKVSVGELIHPDDRERVWDQTQRALAKHERFQCEYRMIDRAGREKWVWEQGCGVYGEDGEVVALEGFIADITERRQSEERVAVLNFALNHVQEIVFLIDRDARFLFVNDEACRRLEYSRHEMLGFTVKEIDPIFGADRNWEQHWREHWREIQAKRSVSFESVHRTRSGRTFPVEVIGNYFEYGGQEYDLALIRDISVRKEQEQRVERLAYHDTLTDLPNRLLLMERLEQCLASTRRHDRALAVLFVDLDRFKNINDTLGHAAGDLLLQQAAARLVKAVREDDTVGRLGGDEFLVLVSDLAKPDDCALVVAKLREAFAEPFYIAGRLLHVTASIGISLFPQDADSGEALIRYADNALYLAKEEGRDTYRYFRPELDSRTHERLELENGLYQALQRGELFLHYQPQVCLRTGRVTAVEALLRWQHPEMGLIPPDKFIPIAEDVGLIVPIGAWVLSTACTMARQWRQDGFRDLRVSVNLSMKQFEQSDVVHTIVQIMEETGCDPQQLELEITESSIMARPDRAVDTLRCLHELGISLALDDFGTGYSSLSHLKRLPLDRLKIDRSFVWGLPHDKDDTAIVKATIALAQQLNLAVVAEGVETHDQRQFLRAVGCDAMQGFLMSKPIPAEDLLPLLTRPAPSE